MVDDICLHDTSIEGGHVTRWFHEIGYITDERAQNIALSAVAQGSIEILEFLNNSGYDWFSQLMLESIVRYHRVDVLEWTLRNRCPVIDINELVIRAANVHGGCDTVLQWLTVEHRHKFEFYTCTQYFIVPTGVRFTRHREDIDCPADSNKRRRRRLHVRRGAHSGWFHSGKSVDKRLHLLI